MNKTEILDAALNDFSEVNFLVPMYAKTTIYW